MLKAVSLYRRDEGTFSLYNELKALFLYRRAQDRLSIGNVKAVPIDGLKVVSIETKRLIMDQLMVLEQNANIN